MLWGPCQAPHPCHCGYSIHESIAQVRGTEAGDCLTSAGQVILSVSLSGVSPAASVLWWPVRGIPTPGARSHRSIHMPLPQASELNRNLTLTMAFHLLGL